MAKIKLVILDFDGTIADTRGIIVRTMRQTAATLGLPQHSDEEYASRIGLPLRQTFTSLIDLDDETADRCEATYRRLFEANDGPDAVTAFPKVVETIKALAAGGTTVTVATSRGRASAEAFLERLGIAGSIGYVLGGDDVDNAKPHPEPVARTLVRYGMKACEALVVGDTHYDILMAHGAGVRAVGVTYGNGTREELVAARADFLIDDFAELLGLV